MLKSGWVCHLFCTHADPAMSSTFTVNRATLRVLKEEFERGHDFARGIEQDIEGWGALVHPTEFFTKNKDMIRIDVLASTEEQHQQWFGLVPYSKVIFGRRLTISLEKVFFRTRPHIRLWRKAIEYKHAINFKRGQE